MRRSYSPRWDLGQIGAGGRETVEAFETEEEAGFGIETLTQD